MKKDLNARFAFLLEIFRSLSSIAFASAALMLIAPAMLVAQTSESLVTSRIIQPIDENARVTLKGNVRQDLATAPDLGSVEDGKPLHLYLLLQRSTTQQADLDNLLARQEEPTAPEYHKWLTPKEFGARFGASPEDIAKITAWLESHGFQIRSVLNNASMIDFAGTAGQVREAFHTELHYFNIRGGRHAANIQDPQIPAALAPVVAGIKGLSKIPAHANHTKIRQSSYDADTHRWHPVDPTAADKASPAYNAGSGYYLVTPQDFYTIYNVNPAFSGGELAAKATVAVIEESDIEYGTVGTGGVATGGDVATFRSLFGVPGTLNMHVYHGYGTVTCNDPGIDPDGTGEDQEASLDAEWINATAPSANLIFMSCDQSPDNGIFSSMAALIDNSLSDVMSLSYGESELFYASSDYTAQDTLYAQAALQGQSIFISSGDSGSDIADQNTSGTATSGINVSAFGAPTVTVTGGTDFSDYYDAAEGGPAQSTYWSATNSAHYGDALSYIPETAWNDSCASSIYAIFAGPYTGAGECGAIGAGADGSVVGGSGGISTHYTVPAWQTGISGYSGSFHSQPDIAGFAASGFWGHYLIYCDSNPVDASTSGCTSAVNFGGAGGTSFVAPYMAGVAGLLVDYTGSRQGLLNPALYALAKAQFTGSGTATACYSNGQTSNTGVTTGLPAAACIFNDVTTSNNDVPCQSGSTSCFVNSGDSFGMLSLNGSSSLTVAYPSTPGFDQTAGIGTVNAYNLITQWNTAFTSTTSLQALPTSITSSQSTELTATVAGGTPTGYVDTPPALTGTASFAAGSTSLGSCTLSAGTCSLSVPGSALQSGANSVTATFLGSGAYPTSTSSIVTVTVTNTSGTPASITASSGTPQSAAINTAFAAPLVATVKDSGGNPVQGVTVTFTAPASGASGSFAGSNTAITKASGVATSTVFTANATAGSYTVAATVAGVTTAASFALTNTAGTASSITASSGTPQSAAINTAFAAPLVATVKDSGGNPVAGVTVTFTAPATGASGSFAGGVNTAPTNSSGVATSATITANATAGSYTVAASVAGVSTPASFALTNAAGTTATYTIGGNVSGLRRGKSVTLLDNGGDPLTVDANGRFTFTKALPSGASYDVTVGDHPTDGTCTVARGSGTVGSANVTNVDVDCRTKTYTIGGNVSGLRSGKSVTLLDNGRDPLTVDANGRFTFTKALPSGASYDVTVGEQPTDGTCTVARESGTVGSADVTNVDVDCRTKMVSRVAPLGTADTTKGPPPLVGAKPDAVPAQPQENKQGDPSLPPPVRPKAKSPEAPSENLVVYQDGKVIFPLKPSQDVDPSSVKSGETTARSEPSATDPALGFSGKTNLQVLQRVEPEYPEAARQQHIQGQVVLEAYVGKDGAVQQLTVISGNSMLATAASDAVRQWRFKPFVQNGRAGEFQTRIKVHFVLP